MELYIKRGGGTFLLQCLKIITNSYDDVDDDSDSNEGGGGVDNDDKVEEGGSIGDNSDSSEDDVVAIDYDEIYSSIRHPPV